MPAPSLCVVSGVVYDENGVPAVGVTIYLKRVLLNGVLIGTAPIGTVSIPQLAGGDHTIQYIEAITSIAGGVVSFTVPQLSTVYLEGNVSGYNNGEIALSIPATATATLEALTPATFPINVTTFTFLSLVDTPDDFTGQALKNVRVNAAGTALEFAAPVVVDNETVQDALSAFFPDVAPFDWTYDDAGDRVTLAILDATASARGLMSTAYATKLDAITAFGLSLIDDANAAAGRTTLELSSTHSPTFTGLTTTGVSVFNQDAFRISTGFHAALWNGGQVQWSSTILSSGTADVGLARRAAGVLRTTNGSTGSGQLLIGSSTDTIAAQLHTLSNAIGVIPLIAEGPAGLTASIFEGRVNGTAMGILSAAGALTISSSLTIGVASLIRSNSTAVLRMPSDGLFRFNNWNENGGIVHFQFHTDTSLSRSAAGILQIGTGAVNALGILDASAYRIAGTKVVGAQGAAVIDATDNPSAITQLNALLARLRAHGLIAT